MIEIDYKNLILNNKKFIKKNKSTVLNITSDWAPVHDDVPNIMRKKAEKYYGNLIEYFKNGDLNITNLETVIDFKVRLNKKNALRFINKPEILKSLKYINTNLVCLANNHIMDNGYIGLKNTIKNLKKYSVNYVGAGTSYREIYKPFLFKKNNQKIAIINTSEGEEANEKYNNYSGSSDIESYKIIDQIREYKKKGFYIILIAHAGIEYIPVPPPYVRKIFKNFVNEGADLIVGHHPHVSQGFEIYKNSPIFYSLGNFTMWKKNLRKNCYHSFFLNIEIQGNKFSRINLIPFQINKNGLQLTPKHNFSKKIKELNNFLSKSDLIWSAYLNRINSKGSLFTENLSYLYNYDYFINKQVNNYTNLSKKYAELDYLNNSSIKNINYERVLDRWEIKKNRNFFSYFPNIFNPIYITLTIFQKILKNLKKVII